MTDTNAFRRTAIVAEIHAERDRQDAQWGGPAHDDEHYGEDWMEFIQHQLTRYDADMDDNQSVNIARRRLIKIAALAVAGVESIDRKSHTEAKPMSETRLTPARRAELARLCEAATEGPWRSGPHYRHDIESSRGRVGTIGNMGAPQAIADAAFIVAARTALPEALAEVDRLTALASDERRRAERLHDDLLVEKGFVTVLRDDIARLKAKVARLEQEP